MMKSFSCSPLIFLVCRENRRLRQLPVWGLCVKELSLLAREWRYSPAIGSTGFASTSFGSCCLPLVSTVARTKAGKLRK
jgi:hypothetical protein